MSSLSFIPSSLAALGSTWILRQARAQADVSGVVFAHAAPGNSSPPLSHPSLPFLVKLKRLFNFRRVDAEPALKFSADWQTAAHQLPGAWIRGQEKYKPSTVSKVLVSKIKAMEYERKHRAELKPEELIFSDRESPEQYRDAQVKLFLEAIGEEVNEVLKSFEEIGMGYQDRHVVSATTVVKSALNVTRTITPDPLSKVALTAVGVVLEAITAGQSVHAADKRFWTAGSEEIVPKGKCDDSPTSKEAPFMLKAAHDVIWKMRSANKVCDQVRVAQQALEQAINDTAATKDARDALELAFARHCYQMKVKANYKASNDSGRKEWYGNLGRNVAGIGGAAALMQASLWSILTPAILAPPVSAGLIGGALVVFAALYLAYHFSDHPQKDGKRKAERQIIGLIKSMDVFSEEARPSYKKRAQAHKEYIKALKKIARESPRFPNARQKEERKQAERKAKQEHLQKLYAISRTDGDQTAMTARQNWERYRKHEMVDLANAGSQDEKERLVKAFEKELESSIETKIPSGAWKTDINMRMDSSKRILAGKIGKYHRKLILHNKGSKLDCVRSAAQRQQRKRQIEDKLFNALAGIFNLELGLRRMNDALKKEYASPELRQEMLEAAQKDAGHSIAAIKDEDVRALFNGDATAQVNSTYIAKSLTAGERDRYFWPIVGAATYGIASNVAFTLGDLGIAVQKYQHTYDGLKVIDAKLLRGPQTNATTGAYTVSAARTSIRNALFAPYQSKLKEEATHKPVTSDTLFAALQDDGRSFFDRENDEDVKKAIHDVIKVLGNQATVPESLALQEQKLDDRIASLLSKGAASDPGVNAFFSDFQKKTLLTVKLADTDAFYRSIVDSLSTGKQLHFQMKKAGWLLMHMANALGGSIVQGCAKVNLNKTRKAMDHTLEQRPAIRRLLAQAALQQ